MLRVSITSHWRSLALSLLPPSLFSLFPFSLLPLSIFLILSLFSIPCHSTPSLSLSFSLPLFLVSLLPFSLLLSSLYLSLFSTPCLFTPLWDIMEQDVELVDTKICMILYSNQNEISDQTFFYWCLTQQADPCNAGDGVNRSSLTCGKQQSSRGTLRYGCRTGREYPLPYTAHTQILWLGIAEKKATRAVLVLAICIRTALLFLSWTISGIIFTWSHLTIEFNVLGEGGVNLGERAAEPAAGDVDQVL